MQCIECEKKFTPNDGANGWLTCRACCDKNAEAVIAMMNPMLNAMDKAFERVFSPGGEK